MLYVDLVPDPATERELTEDWAVLERHGLPNQSRHPGSSNRPHVTLAVAAVDLDDARLGALRSVVGSALPRRLAAGPLALFDAPRRTHAGDEDGPRRWVLVRSVVPDVGLLALHDGVVGALSTDHSPDGAADVTRPWVPHLTVARGLDRAQLDRALDLIDASPPQRSRRFVAGRVWDASRRELHLLPAREADGSD